MDLIWCPSENQELLLKAALLTDNSAVNYWQRWTDLVDPRNAGRAESRLFPLVYHNLQKLGYKDQYTELLRRVHRESFKSSVSLLQIAGNISALLKNKGIRTILLKGIPLGVQYYPSPALRPMSDIDLMVEPENLPKTVEILNGLGWHSSEIKHFRIIEIIHSCQFLDTDNRELDLHWRLMRDCWNSDKNDGFWENSKTLRFHSFESLALSATDQLFHVCCHGARYNTMPPIRWVADAMMILRSGDKIDWLRVLSLSKTHRLSLPLFYSLQYLKEKFNAELPDDFLETLERIPKSRLERMSFKHFSQHPQRWSVWRFIKEAAFQYSTLRTSTNLRPRSLAFIRYLEHFLTKEKIIKKLSSPLP